MSTQRNHYVTTSDGVSIGGTVHGDGPPLVFLQGVIGDGDLDWGSTVEYLTDKFTCHLPSSRGRGLSGDHPDLSIGRLVDDVLTYVDSIGEPRGLVGWSGGAFLALVAAGVRADAVNSMALVEPVMPRLMDEHESGAFGGAGARMGELAAEGRLTDAARTFGGVVFNDKEIAVAEDAGYFEASGRYVPNLLTRFQQSMEHKGPTAEDPGVLGAISVPVLVLLGSDTKPHFTTAARHVADHVPNTRIQTFFGAGHAIPLTHPEVLAEALTQFFSPVQQPT